MAKGLLTAWAFTMCLLGLAPSAWARGELLVPSDAYLITEPYRYDSATPYAGGQNRGADVVAVGGVARALTEGRVAFAGDVAGRRVVTVRSSIDGVDAIVTYTGLLGSELRAGARVSSGAVIGRALAVHVGAYVHGDRHDYLPVVAHHGAGVAPPVASDDRARSSVRSPIADAVARRLRTAIDGTVGTSSVARSSARVRAPASMLHVPARESPAVRSPREAADASSARQGRRAPDALRAAIESLTIAVRSTTTITDATARSAREGSPRMPHGRAALRDRDARRATARASRAAADLDRGGVTVHATRSVGDARVGPDGAGAQPSDSVSSGGPPEALLPGRAPTVGPSRVHASTAPVPHDESAAGVASVRSLANRVSTVLTRARGVPTASGHAHRVPARGSASGWRRVTGSGLLLLVAIAGAVVAARRRGRSRCVDAEPPLHRWRPRWPSRPPGRAHRRAPRERIAQRVRLVDIDGPGASRRETSRRPREPA